MLGVVQLFIPAEINFVYCAFHCTDHYFECSMFVLFNIFILFLIWTAHTHPLDLLTHTLKLTYFWYIWSPGLWSRVWWSLGSIPAFRPSRAACAEAWMWMRWRTSSSAREPLAEWSPWYVLFMLIVAIVRTGFCSCTLCAYCEYFKKKCCGQKTTGSNLVRTVVACISVLLLLISFCVYICCSKLVIVTTIHLCAVCTASHLFSHIVSPLCTM